MLYVPQRRIIGGRLPQDSATSEIESRELLYHSWRTPKIACHFCNIRQKKIAELLAREPVCCACKERQVSSSGAALRRGWVRLARRAGRQLRHLRAPRNTRAPSPAPPPLPPSPRPPHLCVSRLVTIMD